MPQNDRSAFKILRIASEQRIVLHTAFNHVRQIFRQVFMNKELIAESIGTNVYLIAANQLKALRNNDYRIPITP